MAACLKKVDDTNKIYTNTFDDCIRIVFSSLYGRNSPVIFCIILFIFSTISLSVGLLSATVLYEDEISLVERQKDRISDLEDTINHILNIIDSSFERIANEEIEPEQKYLWSKGEELK